MNIRIVGTGDIVPAAAYKPWPDSPFYGHTRAAALTVANLEMALTERLLPKPSGISLHAPPAYAGDIAAVGVDVVSLANNHTGDHGPAGWQDTIAACAAAGVRAIGYGADQRAAAGPWLIDLPGGATAAVVSTTCVGPRRYFAGEGPGVSGIRVTTNRRESPSAEENPGQLGIAVTEPDEADLRIVAEAVRTARARTPLVVAVVHWGVGGSETVHDYMRIIAERLIDAGARVVFGHHNHTVMGIAWYKQSPIFYGLNSFVFQYDGPVAAHMPRDVVLGQVILDSETGELRAAGLVVGTLDADGLPIPVEPAHAAHVVESIKRQSAGVAFTPTPDGAALAPLAG